MGAEQGLLSLCTDIAAVFEDIITLTAALEKKGGHGQRSARSTESDRARVRQLEQEKVALVDELAALRTQQAALLSASTQQEQTQAAPQTERIAAVPIQRVDVGTDPIIVPRTLEERPAYLPDTSALAELQAQLSNVTQQATAASAELSATQELLASSQASESSLLRERNNHAAVLKQKDDEITRLKRQDTATSLSAELDSLRIRKSELDRLAKQQASQLLHEQAAKASLQTTLDIVSAELKALKFERQRSNSALRPQSSRRSVSIIQRSPSPIEVPSRHPSASGRASVTKTRSHASAQASRKNSAHTRPETAASASASASNELQRASPGTPLFPSLIAPGEHSPPSPPAIFPSASTTDRVLQARPGILSPQRGLSSVPLHLPPIQKDLASTSPQVTATLPLASGSRSPDREGFSTQSPHSPRQTQAPSPAASQSPSRQRHSPSRKNRSVHYSSQIVLPSSTAQVPKDQTYSATPQPSKHHSAPNSSAPCRCMLCRYTSSSSKAHDVEMDAVRVGDRIILRSSYAAIVRWVGVLHDAPGSLSIGLQLDAPQGHHDGVHNSRRYFQTPPNQGLFATLADIVAVRRRNSSGFVSLTSMPEAGVIRP
eukprot:m.50901 g.50901  ORF g.50901 m.50901 type:complete len:604 (+) comp48186_c0_seq1:2-1813(+)